MAIIPYLLISSMIGQRRKKNLDTPVEAPIEKEPGRANWKVFGIIGGAVVFVGLVATLWVVALPWLTQKTILLVPVKSEQIQVQPAALQTTASILTERSQKLGYKAATFSVNSSGQIIGRVPNDLDSKSITELYKTGLLEMVDTGQTPFPEGQIIRTDTNSVSSGTGDGPVWHTLLTNKSFHTINLSKDAQGEYEITFILTEEGTKTLADFSTKNINSFLTITFDKKVISSPRIQAPITEGSGVIRGVFTQAEANNLVADLQTQPLPISLEQSIP